MDRHVVIGKGIIGSATARHLARLGHEVRVISRSGATAQPGIEHVAVDVTDAAALRAATAGASVIYNCVNPAYHRWLTDWPPMAGPMLDAAEAADAVYVLMANLYGYGPVDRPMTEDMPLASPAAKAQVRVHIWEDALERHHAGRVRVAEARASDYFGPEVLDTSHLGDRFVPPLLAGKTVRVVGDPDAPHSFTYVPDIARTLVRLGLDERAWGRAWHVPTAPPLNRREVAARMARVAGVAAPGVKQIPWWTIRATGLVMPLMRELEVVRYQWDQPFVVDSSAYTSTFGEQPTNFDTALAETVSWWRGRAPSTPAVA